MKNLYKALADFQQEVPVIYKGTQGYGYSYADWPTILDVINPLMKKHGLGFYQAVNNSSLKTVVFHIETGEIIESETNIPQDVQLKGMNPFQVLGSGITYIRRYALSSLLGLVTDKDTDGAEVHQEVRHEAKVDEGEIPICDKCGSFKKLIPAGISKSGKAYNAFYSCPNRCQ